MTVRKRQGTVSTRWQASWKKPDGKRGFKDFPTRAQAIAFETKMKADIIRGDYANPISGKTKLEVVYLSLQKTFDSKKPKTKEDYESLWKNMVQPTWGHRSLNSITKAEFRMWISESKSLTGKKVSSSRIRKAAILFNLILEHAIELDLISKNPIGKIKGSLPKITQAKKRKSLELHQLLKLSEACGEYRLLVLVAGFLGLRWAELIALTPEDFDFKSDVIHVNKSLSDVNGKLILVGTKSGNSRELPLPDFLKNDLKLLVFSTPSGKSVFRTTRGENLRKSNFSKRIFKPALKQAGLSDITFHELRHTAISLQISGGADVVSVSKIAGHSSPSTTLRIYAHELDGSKEKIKTTIEKNFSTISDEQSRDVSGVKSA
jgi:integrase